MIRTRRSRHVLFAGLVLALTAVTIACTVNPATGKRQLNLFSEEQEIAIGRDADPQIVAQFGLYPDDDLQDYISELGQALAAESERPNLPWTFRVVDDPVVNAFALPGGFIYITRGILSHLGSEAEIAGVLGHEIGHVTARHGVNQMTKAQLAQVGLVAGVIAAPEVASQFGDLAMGATQLMFLKFGRDDERQADALGFRYMSRVGEPPAALADVFKTLGGVSAASPRAGSVPSWLSTHPDPGDREQRIREQLASVSPDLVNAPDHRDRYLGLIDGIVFGNDPRQGFFRGQTFYHPELAFELTFPDGWQTQNTRQAVIAMEPNRKALIALTLADEGDVRAAAQKFFELQGVEEQGRWLDRRNLTSQRFRLVQNEQEQLRGGVAFTKLGDQVFRILAYAGPNDWNNNNRATQAAAASFSRLTDRRLLSVEPRRLDVVTLSRAMTLADFQRAYPSSVSLDELARINQVDDPATRFERGTRLKRVVGEDPSRP